MPRGTRGSLGKGNTRLTNFMLGSDLDRQLRTALETSMEASPWNTAFWKNNENRPKGFTAKKLAHFFTRAIQKRNP
jgi:hypothetical protein